MIIVDSGYWFGLFDRKDANHAVCKAFLAHCREPLITTFPVLTEALHLLMRREKVRLAFEFLAFLSTLQQQGNFSVFSLADASLVLLAEQLGHGRILSTDQRASHLPLEKYPAVF
jgi:predicted nucleic acid-binding protein